MEYGKKRRMIDDAARHEETSYYGIRHSSKELA
jgi:hypothetical protein